MSHNFTSSEALDLLVVDSVVDMIILYITIFVVVRVPHGIDSASHRC